MPNTLQIPQAVDPNVIEGILNRMTQRESSGDPRAVGKAGGRGLLQIKPTTAAQYGITNPDLLFNPQVNRYVARRYLTDLVHHYKGDISKAVEAYNAGPGNVDKGRIPESSAKYMAYAMGGAPTGAQSRFSIGSLLGEGTANAAEYTGPVLSVKPPTSARPADAYTGPVLPAKPPGAAKPEPLGARAASYLPMVGQFGGEALGAAGGAAIPGLGETGVPEFAGAAAGGAVGSGLGAAAENVIRRQYGLPSISVGSEAAWGGAGSAVGGMLPLVARFRKAAQLAKQTGIGFTAALERVKNIEAGLEGALGMGARKAKLLEGAPASATKGAYSAARGQGLDEIGSHYDTIIGQDADKLTPMTARQTLQGSAGKMLDLTGKGLRQSVEDEFSKSPMTVSRVQKLISVVRAQRRMLNPETQAPALRAYDDIIKALQSDRDAVIGPTKAAAVKVVDGYYARQIARFPLKPAFRAATTETGAAEAILKHKPSEVGRVLDVIREMKRTGQIAVLRRATAAKIFQAAKVSETATPIARLNSLVKAVQKESPEVFDELYGSGARKTWLDTAAALTKREKELLEHKDEAAAIGAELSRYLSEPGLLARMSKNFGHRLLFDALIFGGGFETGHMAAAGAAILGIEGMEMVAHSRGGMWLLRKAASEKRPREAARLIVAALSTAMRGGAESALGGDDAK